MLDMVGCAWQALENLSKKKKKKEYFVIKNLCK